MKQRSRVRFRWQARTVASLTLVWLLLWGRLDLVTVTCGVLVGYLVSVVFPMPPVRVTGRLRPLGVVRLVWRLFVELTQASLRLVGATFRRRLELRPAIVRVDLVTRSDLVQVVTAAYVSLVPGTLVIEAPRTTRRLYLHVFDASTPQSAQKERDDALRAELLVLEAFGSDDELDRARAGLAASPPHPGGGSA